MTAQLESARAERQKQAREEALAATHKLDFNLAFAYAVLLTVAAFVVVVAARIYFSIDNVDID